MKQAPPLILFLTFTLLLGSCFFFVPGCTPREAEELTVLSWNVENLFDDVDNGTEYREYKPGDDWTARDYHQRMILLSRVIEEAVPGGPDIILLQEVENQNVLDTWNNRYLKNLGYQAALAAPSPGAATIGILSRFPVTEYRLHRTEREGYTLGRPIAETVIQAPGGDLRLFNNHWKSKSGGADETEPLRQASAEALKRRISELSPGEGPLILGGDFNEAPDEYLLRGALRPTALMVPQGTRGFSEDQLRLCLVIAPMTEYPPAQDAPGNLEGPLDFFTPWPLMEGGSYHYNGIWERIDNFFLSGDLMDGEGWEWKASRVIRESWMLTDRGTPRGWNREAGTGYSDHLPLLLTLRYEKP